MKIEIKDFDEVDHFLVFVNGQLWTKMKDLTDRDSDSSFSEDELNDRDLCFCDGYGHVFINDELIFDRNVANFSLNRLRKEIIQKRTELGSIKSAVFKNLYASKHVINAIFDSMFEQQDSYDTKLEKVVL